MISFREVSPAIARTACHYLNCVKSGEKCRPGSSKTTLECLSNAPHTELIIEQLKNYPVGSSFPTTLTKLHIKGIKLDNFDTRILRLMHLSILTIEGSNISAITKDIAKLSLVRLSLNSNSVVAWPSIPKESPLSSFLAHLDLSGNKITRLPVDFWNLENLETLNLNDNQLIGLPPVNLHRVRRLRDVSLRNNQLGCLPFSFTCLQSSGTLDLSDNPWVTPSLPLHVANFEPKSLFHYTTVAFLQVFAKFCWWPSVVTKARWEHEDDLPERIATEALGVLRRCAVCLKICGPESHRFVDAVELRFAQRVVSTPSSVIHYCCSNRCAQRFNPSLSIISV
nr:leucine rich repeat protein 1 [Hymenolepis microstoma]